MKAYSRPATGRASMRKELPDMEMKGGLHRQGDAPWGAQFIGEGPDGRRYVVELSHAECLDVIRTAVGDMPDLVEEALRSPATARPCPTDHSAELLSALEKAVMAIRMAEVPGSHDLVKDLCAVIDKATAPAAQAA